MTDEQWYRVDGGEDAALYPESELQSTLRWLRSQGHWNIHSRPCKRETLQSG